MGRESSTKSTSLIKDSIKHIISSALSSGVKTIHIEPSSNFILVRFRRGTKLDVVNKLPRSSAKEFSAQLKKMAKLDSSKTSIPQYGSTKLEIAKKLHEFQVVTSPVIGGEKITIDIIDDTNPSVNLDKIGLWGGALKSVEQALSTNHGLILITSPGLKPAQDLVGVMLGTLVSPTHRLVYFGSDVKAIPKSVDIEDPDNLAEKLKALVVGKYSIIGIGLVNSSTLASQINDLVIKNQHIMAVLPASSTIGALSFWRQMVDGPLLPPFVINQQTVASLCENCKQSYSPSVIEEIQLATNFHIDTPSIMKDLHDLEASAIKAGLGGAAGASTSTKKILKLWRCDPAGCSQCNFSGYGNDIGIFEVLNPSDNLITELNHKVSAIKLQDIALSEGFISLKTDALVKALRGLIDFKTLLSLCSTAN
jgi:type IV pilus assembly protein PilB